MMCQFKGFASWSLPLLLAFALVGCASSGNKKEKAELHLRIGTSHLTQGHYPLALQELLEAEKLDPENEVVQNNLGLAYFVRNQYEAAEKHFHRALELNPKYSDARNNLGRVYTENGQYDTAIKTLTEVTRDLLYNTPEKAYVNLGIVYLKKNEIRTAKTTFEKAIEANNKYCISYNFYGQALFQLRDFSNAQSAFQTALELCKNDYDEAHYFSGLSLYKMGEKEKAIARMNEVIQRYPSSEYSKKAVSMLTIMTKEQSR